MKEWSLIRNKDQYVSMVYYQDDQPLFNNAFGKKEDFSFKARDLEPFEWDQIAVQKRRDLYPAIEELLEAIYEKEFNNDPLPLQKLVQTVNAVVEAVPKSDEIEPPKPEGGT